MVIKYSDPLGRLLVKRKTKKNQKTTSVAGDVGKLESLCTVGGNVKWCSQLLENSKEVFQIIKNRITI